MPRHRRKRTAATIAAGVLAFSAASAHAYWSASQTFVGSGTVIQSDQVVSQAQPSCSNEGGIGGLLGRADVTWTHVDVRYVYDWQLIRVSNGAVENSGTVTPSVAAGQDVTFSVTSSLISPGLLNVNFNLVVRARMAGTNWTAPTSTSTGVQSFNIVLLGLSMRCNPETQSLLAESERIPTTTTQPEPTVPPAPELTEAPTTEPTDYPPTPDR